MEIKEKDDGTYTIKGLELIHLELLATLLAYVKLGDGTDVSNAAYEINELLEEAEVDYSCFELIVSKSNGKLVEDPILELV